MYMGRWDEALREGHKALKASEEHSNKSLISFAASMISLAYTWKCDIARAIEYAEMALQKAPTPADKVWAQTFFACALYKAGEAERAVDLLTPMIPAFQAAGNTFGVVYTSMMLGEAYLRAGEYDKAKETVEQGLKTAEEFGMKWDIGWANRLLGEVMLEVIPDQAPPHFEKAIEIFRKIKAENELALAYAGYGRFQKQKGDITQARDYLNRALEIFERLGTLIEPDKVRQELAELSAD
jgi:tetratricopeptide (TPR) repeat protein